MDASQEQLAAIKAARDKMVDRINLQRDEEIYELDRMFDAAVNEVSLIGQETLDYRHTVKVNLLALVQSTAEVSDVVELMQELTSWLANRGLIKGRDYKVNLGSITTYLFNNARLAMMFKLAWS